ncbi:hypothetical protein C8R47DRAFT_1226173 [Mycena vitilis]|nr:hypothetical protein C8R47DRAFT_1226173 [Mycena vitilis]
MATPVNGTAPESSHDPARAAPPTLLSFFSKVDKKVARPLHLDTPVGHIRKRPLPIGTIRFLPIHLSTDAAGSERLRRYRPLQRASVFPTTRSRIVTASDGRVRETREHELAVEDLWIGAAPPYIAPVNDVYTCAICLQVMSHPVFNLCGHGHCYCCMRVWLEQQWECPECRAIVTRAPFRIYPVETHIQKTYGDWDTSEVEYSWYGLVFPVLAGS